MTTEDLWHTPVSVEGRRGKWWVQKIDYRNPRAGEYYLSGAVPVAYRAPSNLRNAYTVVKPVRRAEQQRVWT